MKRILTFSILCLAAIFSCKAVDYEKIRLHCSEDTAKINRILKTLKTSDALLGKKILQVADGFVGAGYDDYYVADSTATLRINVDSFTPLTFINSVVALAKASEHPGFTDWRTFANSFIDLSCRRGEDKGYPSIMYHTADWIGDNWSRGNLKELTENYSGAIVKTKSLDEMTRNRKRFAALSDSATFESVRMNEMGFRTHRIPVLKKETIQKKEVVDDLQDGDIIILVPNRDGVDMYDIGFISIEDGKPYLIHFSPQTKEIVKEKDTLPRYMQLVTKNFQGYRILRIND